MSKKLRTGLPGIRMAAAALLLLGAGYAYAASQWTFSEFTDLFQSWGINNESRTIAIGNYKTENPLQNLEIPETIVWEDGQTYTVTSLIEFAFAQANNLKSVVLPSTVTSIGDYSFSELQNLASLVIEGNVSSFGAETFRMCPNLESVEFKGDKIGALPNYAFYQDSKLKTVSFAGDVEAFGLECFAECTDLESLDIKGNVKTVSQGVFNGTGITDIEFNAGLESVTLPLRRDDKLMTVTFPQSLKEIKYSDIYGVEEVPHMYYSYGNEHFGIEKITFNVTDLEAWCTTPIPGYNPKKYVRHHHYDENDHSIYTWEFEGEFIPVTINYRGKEITSLNVPMGVETIKPYAFAGVENLSSVALPDDLKEIGEGAFAATSLPSIEFPESVKSLGAYAFASNKDMQDIVLPAGLTALGDYAFYGDIALYEIEIPAGVKRIGAHAFDRCVDMETITLNEGLEEIADHAFYYNSRVKEIRFPESLQAIGERAFAICGMQELEFGDNLKQIGDWAFARYDNALEGNYPDTPNRWVEGEHKDDPTSKIKFGSALESIGEHAFDAWNVRALSLPETVTEIGGYAFQYSKISEITIPAAMKNLGDAAFAGCGNLAVVNFPEGLETIGERAFCHTSMRELNLPASLKEIGKGAFYGAPIVNAVVPDAVTAIGENAFTSVNYLTLGSGLAAISKPIAENCDMLKIKRPTPPTLGTDRLGFTPKVVIVPAEAGDTYRKNNRWKDYNIFGEGENKAIVNVNKEANEQLADQLILQSRLMPAQVASLAVYGELDADDWAVIRSNMTSLYELDLTNIKNTEIPAQALMDKNTLLSLTLPAGTKSIGDAAFRGCTLMHMPTLPEGLETIGEYAFTDCKSLDSEWVMPASLTTVGTSAFCGCESLKSIDFSATSVTALPGHPYNEDEYSWYENHYGIEDGMFRDTYSLSSLILPSGLTAIAPHTFIYSGLKNLELPEGVKEIGAGAFYGSSIKEIRFPEGLETVAVCAFAGSNIEGVSLPASLRTIGAAAFEKTPLVFAEFANGVENLSEKIFANCQDLMVVNLPTSLKSIGKNAIAAPALTAINAPVVEPAATTENPFTGVDNMTCALSIPRQSFTKYVRAEYWGSFVGVRNNIEVTIPTDVTVTYIDEDDYQEMVEDMQEEEETPVEPSSARRRALRVLRANDVISEFKGYGKLFDGAALYRDDKGMTRFFIDLNPSELKDVTVKYNNVDITSQIDPETMSFVTEPLKMNATLTITYKGSSGIEEVTPDQSQQAPVDVYDLTGRRVLTAATDFSGLPAGIYIAGGKKIIVK